MHDSVRPVLWEKFPIIILYGGTNCLIGVNGVIVLGKKQSRLLAKGVYPVQLCRCPLFFSCSGTHLHMSRLSLMEYGGPAWVMKNIESLEW